MHEPLTPNEEIDSLKADAARWRHVRECARCDSKHGNGLTLETGTRLKAVVAFRYWCDPEELDRLIDVFISIPEVAC